MKKTSTPAKRLLQRVLAVQVDTGGSYTLKKSEMKAAKELVESSLCFYCSDRQHIMTYRDQHRAPGE